MVSAVAAAAAAVAAAAWHQEARRWDQRVVLRRAVVPTHRGHPNRQASRTAAVAGVAVANVAVANVAAAAGAGVAMASVVAASVAGVPVSPAVCHRHQADMGYHQPVVQTSSCSPDRARTPHLERLAKWGEVSHPALHQLVAPSCSHCIAVATSGRGRVHAASNVAVPVQTWRKTGASRCSPPWGSHRVLLAPWGRQTRPHPSPRRSPACGSAARAPASVPTPAAQVAAPFCCCRTPSVSVRPFRCSHTSARGGAGRPAGELASSGFSVFSAPSQRAGCEATWAADPRRVSSPRIRGSTTYASSSRGEAWHGCASSWGTAAGTQVRRL